MTSASPPAESSLTLGRQFLPQRMSLVPLATSFELLSPVLHSEVSLDGLLRLGVVGRVKLAVVTRTGVEATTIVGVDVVERDHDERRRPSDDGQIWSGGNESTHMVDAS